VADAQAGDIIHCSESGGGWLIQIKFGGD